MSHPLESCLPRKRLRFDAEAKTKWGGDRTTSFPSNPACIAFPETIEEVVQIVKIANEHKLTLVPSGGRTGLSGGAVAGDELSGEVHAFLVKPHGFL